MLTATVGNGYSERGRAAVSSDVNNHPGHYAGFYTESRPRNNGIPHGINSKGILDSFMEFHVVN